MRVFGLLGVVIVLCVGLYLYQQDIKNINEGSPQQQIDTVAIQQRLRTIGQPERQYQVQHGKFATLGGWFGVSDDNLRVIFPNLANFAPQRLGFV